MLTSESQSLLERIFASLDYDRLGSIYCETGGAAFWEAHREPALRAGIEWARALAERLPRGGTSRYVGAGVAELPALVMETRDLGRRVHIATLNQPESEVLNACLRRLDVDGIEFEVGDAAESKATGDHLSLVSVLNDPVLYPTVSAVGYGRLPPVLLDLDRFTAERQQLRGLVRGLLARLEPPAWITTTVEEVAWILDAAPECGLRVEADDAAVETAIVGDPLGFLRVERL